MSAIVSERLMTAAPTPVLARRSHAAFDRGFRLVSLASAILVLAVLAGILGSILYGGWAAFREFGFLGFLSGSRWNVAAEAFGAWPAVARTHAWR